MFGFRKAVGFKYPASRAVPADNVFLKSGGPEVFVFASSGSTQRSAPRPKAILMGFVFLSAVIAQVCGAETQALQIIQTNYFDTGFDGNGTPLLIPSTDPAGITYHEPSGHLFIADSEINELPTVFPVVGGNIFEVSLAGDTLFPLLNPKIGRAAGSTITPSSSKHHPVHQPIMATTSMWTGI